MGGGDFPAGAPWLVVLLAAASACAPRSAPPPSSPEIDGAPRSARSAPSRSATAPDEVGMASWYGAALAGHRTANGERFDPGALTAAHKTLPFGTWVEVRRVDTGRSVRVRINDRGPNGHAARRIIDVSRRAAEELDMVRAGVARVELRVVRSP
jgi:rare lipoprotein A